MHLSVYSPERFMREAYMQAQMAFEIGEVPIGAVVVCKNRIIARAHNQVEMLKDATAHAEMLALTAAFEYLGSKYLEECSLYVTLEPCVMCAGAMNWAQIDAVYFGASDPKRGFTRILHRILHQKTSIYRGLLENECTTLLNDFFNNLREN